MGNTENVAAAFALGLRVLLKLPQPVQQGRGGLRLRAGNGLAQPRHHLVAGRVQHVFMFEKEAEHERGLVKDAMQFPR